MTDISQAAVDLIVEQEVSDRQTYEKLYRHPTFPGGNSGVTIGIGYDCGWVTSTEFSADWSVVIPDSMVQAILQHAIGVRGQGASEVCHELRSEVDVSWDAAMRVFMARDVPKWINRVQTTLPNTDKLSADCLGALVSLAYNRGTSFSLSGDRYTEMRAIKNDMINMDLEDIPDQFRSMVRLWPNMRGLRTRRMAEAALFEQGLNQT